MQQLLLPMMPQKLRELKGKWDHIILSQMAQQMFIHRISPVIPPAFGAGTRSERLSKEHQWLSPEAMMMNEAFPPWLLLCPRQREIQKLGN